MNTTARALHLLESSALMKQVVALEPTVLDILLATASASPPAGWTRWDAYSALKRQCDPFIGHNARNDELATSAHWEAFVRFIDALLPDSDDYYGHVDAWEQPILVEEGIQ